MQKVRKPQHIARKEHARYLNKLESDVLRLQCEVSKMQKLVDIHKRSIQNIPDLAITFVKKQADISELHADADKHTAFYEQELQNLKTISIDDSVSKAHEVWTQKSAFLDEKIVKINEYKAILEAQKKDLDEKRQFMDAKMAEVEKGKAIQSERLSKLEEIKKIIAQAKDNLETERSSIESKLYVQKRACAKLLRTIDFHKKYVESVQRHLKENSIPILTAQVKYLLEEMKLHSPEFLAARAEFTAIRRKYIKLSKAPLIKLDPLSKLHIGEGELWERINEDAQNNESSEKVELSNFSVLESQS